VLHEQFPFDCRVYQKHLLIIADRYQARKLFSFKLSYTSIYIYIIELINNKTNIKTREFKYEEHSDKPWWRERSENKIRTRVCRGKNGIICRRDSIVYSGIYFRNIFEIKCAHNWAVQVIYRH
jgi:hypothetical protein